MKANDHQGCGAIAEGWHTVLCRTDGSRLDLDAFPELPPGYVGFINQQPVVRSDGWQEYRFLVKRNDGVNSTTFNP